MRLPFGREYPLALKVGFPLGNGTIDVFFSLSELVLVSFYFTAETINSSVLQLNFCLMKYFRLQSFIIAFGFNVSNVKGFGDGAFCWVMLQ